MNILDKIVANKNKEVDYAKRNTSYSQLEEMELFHRDCYSFKEFLLSPERTGIIAEFKRKLAVKRDY